MASSMAAAASSAQARAANAAAAAGTSSSSSNAALKPDQTLKAAKSESQLSRMAMTGTPSRGRTHLDTDSFDTRTASPAGARTPSADSQHPDLSSEVALLSTKLINAINHQTNLDDSLQQTRHELESAKRKIVGYEAKAKEHARLVENGALVRKPKVDAAINSLREELAEAQRQRDIAEKARKEMEVELETLTSALFEEANTMVAAARKDTEGTEKKNAQLRSQLQDTELLLASQQEQLADLKTVMERMTTEHDDADTLPRSSTAPSTPGADTASKMNMFDSFPMSPNTPNFGETPPDQPLRFSHLITPVMRNDVQAYADFADLIKSSRAAAPPHSRGSSGVGFSVAAASSSSAPLSSSSPNIPGSFSTATASSPRDASYASTLPPLKDNKFYKRCLVEDIEPALRLDLAPGLSWLARRTVVGAITSGTLVVEPFIPQSRFYGNVYACSLCGESRRTEAHSRRHRFRTSEDDSAQRYPLCEYCLGRVRATCDFLGFLRMVRDGLWRARNDDDINGAWEEAVRLREKMFWARLGGGVVPVVSARSDSPTTTQRRNRASLMRQDSSHSSNATDATSSLMASPTNVQGIPRIQDPFQSRSPKLSALSTSISNDDIGVEAASDGVDTSDFAAAAHGTVPDDPTTPTTETGDQEVAANVDGPSTPKEQMSSHNRVEQAPLPPQDDVNKEAEDVVPHVEETVSDEHLNGEPASVFSDAEEHASADGEESAPVSSIPGAFD